MDDGDFKEKLAELARKAREKQAEVERCGSFRHYFQIQGMSKIVPGQISSAFCLRCGVRISHEEYVEYARVHNPEFLQFINRFLYEGSEEFQLYNHYYDAYDFYTYILESQHIRLLPYLVDMYSPLDKLEDASLDAVVRVRLRLTENMIKYRLPYFDNDSV